MAWVEAFERYAMFGEGRDSKEVLIHMLSDHEQTSVMRKGAFVEVWAGPLTIVLRASSASVARALSASAGSIQEIHIRAPVEGMAVTEIDYGDSGKRPNLMLLSSGDADPFTIQISFGDGEQVREAADVLLEWDRDDGLAD